MLAGGGRVKLDDEIVELVKLDAGRVSPGTARSFEAGPDGLEVLHLRAPLRGRRGVVQDFWDS